MKELERRIKVFQNAFAGYVSVEHRKLAHEIATKGLSGQGIARIKISELELRLFREKYHGYDTGRKNHTGDSFQKGIIGIALEYFSTHPEELTDDSIRTLCSKLDERVQRYLISKLEIAQNESIPGLTEQGRRAYIAQTHSEHNAIWSVCKNDLAIALMTLRDQYNYEQRLKKSTPIMENKGVLVIGDNNTINANFGDLIIAISSLQAQLEEADNLSTSELRDIKGDLESIKGQLSKTNPDKSIIEKLWDGINVVVTGKGLYDLLLPVTPLITDILVKLSAG